MKQRQIILFITIAMILLLISTGDFTTIAAPSNEGTNPNIYLPMVTNSYSSSVIPDTTVILSESTTQYLTSIDPFWVVFSQSTPELSTLEPGDVIVGGISEEAPNGFLRKVTDIYDNGQVLIGSYDATLEDAIELGGGTFQRRLSPDQIQNSEWLLEGVSLVSSDQAQNDFSFVYSFNNVELYDGIVANGHLEFTIDVFFDFYIENRQLEQLTFTSTVNENAALEISSEIERNFSAEKDIVSHTFAPITFLVPGTLFPIIIAPELTISVGADGRVYAGLSTGATQDVSLTAGLQYSEGNWEPVSNFSNEFQYTSPTVSANLDVEGYTEGTLAFKLYGVAGLNVKIKPSVQLVAALNANPWWSLYGGIDALVGIEAEILGQSLADYETTLFEYRVLLTEAEEFPGNLDLTCEVYYPTSGFSAWLEIIITTSVPVPGGPLSSAKFDFELTSEGGPIDDILRPSPDEWIVMQFEDTQGSNGDLGILTACNPPGGCTAVYTITEANLYQIPLDSVIGETVECSFTVNE